MSGTQGSCLMMKERRLDIIAGMKGEIQENGGLGAVLRPGKEMEGGQTDTLTRKKH